MASRKLNLEDERDADRTPDAPHDFSKIIVSEYYDGAVSGVLLCAECGNAYRFDMLDWDLDLESPTAHIRIFDLARIPERVFDELVSFLSNYETPRWPVWVPRWSPTSEDVIQNAIDTAMDQAGPVELLIATDHLGGEIVRERTVTPDERLAFRDWAPWMAREAPPVDWDPFAYLGLRNER